MIKSEQLTTLGFGIPNLLKFGEVGYFPEQFLVDMGLQGKTALEIKRFFSSRGPVMYRIIICRGSDGRIYTSYFVDFKHNVFIKYYYIDEEEK